MTHRDRLGDHAEPEEIARILCRCLQKTGCWKRGPQKIAGHPLMKRPPRHISSSIPSPNRVTFAWPSVLYSCAADVIPDPARYNFARVRDDRYVMR